MSKRSLLEGGFLLMTGVTVLIWAFVFFLPAPALSVSFLDVGQGDAIFIESPTGVQVLIDGGRDRSVLRELGKVMGPLDRSIDMVVETHPDADHIGGLSEVFVRYGVSHFMEPGIPNDTSSTHALTDAVVHEPGIEKIIARRGQRIHLGRGAYADVLFPDREVSGLETNTGSVILRFVYGNTSFILTGDAPSTIEDYLVSLDGAVLASDVLKAGHHGSRSSTDKVWLATVSPETLVISAGKDNSYGHPAPEVLERAAAAGVNVVSTIEEGTITFVSDGRTIRKK